MWGGWNLPGSSQPTRHLPAASKYTGDVRLLKSGKSEVNYLASGNNPAIISKEDFEAVQTEKARRSNVVIDENGSKRKNERYSSKGKG